MGCAPSIADIAKANAKRVGESMHETTRHMYCTSEMVVDVHFDEKNQQIKLTRLTEDPPIIIELKNIEHLLFEDGTISYEDLELKLELGKLDKVFKNGVRVKGKQAFAAQTELLKSYKDNIAIIRQKKERQELEERRQARRRQELEEKRQAAAEKNRQATAVRRQEAIAKRQVEAAEKERQTKIRRLTEEQCQLRKDINDKKQILRKAEHSFGDDKNTYVKLDDEEKVNFRHDDYYIGLIANINTMETRLKATKKMISELMKPERGKPVRKKSGRRLQSMMI